MFADFMAINGLFLHEEKLLSVRCSQKKNQPISLESHEDIPVFLTLVTFCFCTQLFWLNGKWKYFHEFIKNIQWNLSFFFLEENERVFSNISFDHFQFEINKMKIYFQHNFYKSQNSF